MYCFCNKGTPLIFSEYHLLGLFLLKLNVYIGTWKLSLFFGIDNDLLFFKGIDFTFKIILSFQKNWAKITESFHYLLSLPPPQFPLLWTSSISVVHFYQYWYMITN